MKLYTYMMNYLNSLTPKRDEKENNILDINGSFVIAVFSI